MRILLGLIFLSLASQALAQFPTSSPSSGAAAPEVRIAEEDPRKALERERRLLMERQQQAVARALDAEVWQKRQKAVEHRLLELQTRRRELLRDQPPTEAERRLSPPSAPMPDGGLPDVGIYDAGVPDAAAKDAKDAGTDGGLPDAAPDAALPAVYLPVIPSEKQYLAPAVHPAELAELDGLLSDLEILRTTLESLLRVHRAEWGNVVEALARDEALLRELNAQANPDNAQAAPPTPSLRETEAISLEVHRARIEVALAKARHQQRMTEGGEGGGESAELSALAPLEPGDYEPWASFEDSFLKAESQRGERQTLRAELDRFNATLTSLKTPAKDAIDRLNRMELLTAEHRLKVQEKAFGAALGQMQITVDDVAWARQIVERSEALRGTTVPRIEAELDKLRETSVLVDDEDNPFSTPKVKALQRSALAEQLLFERLKLQRDTFRLALAELLTELAKGSALPDSFLKTHEPILDAPSLQGRRADFQARCDGWRRAQNTLRGETRVDSAFKANRAKLLAAYESLADTCMREEWVLDTEARLSEIARFHLDQHVKASRGLWWYGWRSVVTVLLALLALVGGRWLGRVTRTLAGRQPQPDGEEHPAEEPTNLRGWWQKRAPRLRALAALLLYLAGLSVLFVGAGLLSANLLWGADYRVEELLRLGSHPLVFVGERGVSAWSVVQVALWVVASVWVARGLGRFVSDLLERFAVERGLRDTVGALTRYLVIVSGLALGLSSVGIGLASVALAFGVIGIGIGFGLQTIANNFISGFLILLERPIRKGDFVQVGDMVGEVKAINARATTIETRDGVSVIVPNSEFVSGRVVNWTLGHRERLRTRVKVGVAYGTEVQLVKRLLLEVAEGHPGVLPWPKPHVELTGFGDSSLDFALLVWTRRVRALPVLVSELNMAVEEAFKRHGVEIPFPQRDVHLVPLREQPVVEAEEEEEALYEEAAALTEDEPKPTPKTPE